MWSAGTIPQEVPGAIIATFPTINILAICFILNGSFGRAKFVSIFDQG